jgi:hypothetical protein
MSDIQEQPTCPVKERFSRAKYWLFVHALLIEVATKLQNVLAGEPALLPNLFGSR